MRKKMRKNKIKNLDKHILWLETLVKAGKKIDMDKLTTKKVYSKYFDRENIVQRNQNETKYIVSRLVSKFNLEK